MFGVALGVMALTIVISVINGFEGELTRMITKMNGDVLFYSRGEPVQNPDQMELDIRKVVPEVAAMSRLFVLELMLSGPRGATGGILEGIEPETIGLVTDIPQSLVAGRLPVTEGEAALGSALAEKLGVEIGTEFKIVAPFAGETESQPRSTRVRAVGIFKMGMFEYDSKILLMSLDSVQKFLDQRGKVTNFNIRLQDGVDARDAANRLSESFGYPFRAKDWSQLNKNLFYAIKLEKMVITIILTVIVIVAAFNVVSTLMMMIHDKTKEIAILKVMGFQRFRSFQLFCFIGTAIGVVGTSVGILFGLAVGWLLQKTQWIQLPPDIYYIHFLPVVVRWKEILVIAGCALAISFFATLYPSWKVANRSPLDGMRYE